MLPDAETEDQAEDLIARLSGGLGPVDRDEFRRAAESALATSRSIFCTHPRS
jgi:hypothetical protein